MPVVTMPDGVNVRFPDDMPVEQIKGLIAQKYPNEVKALSQPKQPKPDVGSAVAGEWNDRSNTEGKIVLPGIGAPSLMGIAQGVGNFVKSTLQGFRAPGMAVRGEFEPQLETPGVMTEEDAFRRNTAKDAEGKLAGQMAAGIMGGAIPGGIFAAPRGAITMGAARPPIGGVPVPPPEIAAQNKAVFDSIYGTPKAGPAATPIEAAGRTLREFGYPDIDKMSADIQLKTAEMLRKNYPNGPPINAAKINTGGGAAPPPPPPSAPPAAAAAPGAPDLVEAATRINVPVPRYMASDSRLTQGVAAGLQNIPGAGDKIAKAADVTQKALGTAATTVREGFGSGVPSVAGSDAKDALATWITDGSKATAEKLYNKVDALVDPAVTTELKTTANAAQQIMARRANSKIPGESGAVKTVMDAVTTPGGMNYQGIKGLRTYIGEMTPEELVSQGLNKAEAKQIYGALSVDLRMAALNGGGAQGLSAFNKANRVFDEISTRREALSKIIGAKGDVAPEAVFSRLVALASNKTNADIGKLAQARKAIGPEAWDEVASAVVARLGRDPAGEFSIKRFLGPNGWGGLSDPGKNVLFKSTGKSDLAKSLDDIAFVSKALEEKMNKFYNPSGTGKSIAATGVALGILKHPVYILSTILGGGRIAAVLSEPATARATAEWTKAYHAALVAPHVASRSRTVREAAEKLAGLISKDNPTLDKNALFAQMMAGQTMSGGVGSSTTTKP